MSKMANMAMSQQTQDMEIGDSEDSDLENGAIKMQVTAAQSFLVTQNNATNLQDEGKCPQIGEFKLFTFYANISFS